MKKFIILLVAVFIGLGFQSVHAIPTLQLSDGIGAPVIIADGDPLDSVGLTGVVGFNGAINSWILSVATGITMPASGTAALPYLHLDSINMSNSAGTMTIMFSETGFGPIDPGVNMLVTSVGGLTQGTASFSTWLGSTLFDQDTLLANIGPFGPVVFAGSAKYDAVSSIPSSFSLTEIATITHGSGINVSSFNIQIAVPEPGTIILLGSGLIGFAIYARRKMK